MKTQEDPKFQKDRREKILYWIDVCGMIIIGGLCYGYFMFESVFAENHIKLSFLDFPIFVGEIGIFALLLLSGLKYWIKPFKINKWHALLLAYFLFVGWKGLTGYLTWGPLACRNAALLYYPIFALFGYSFFRRQVFHPIVVIAIVGAILFPMWHGIYYDFWVLTGILLSMVLILSLRNLPLRIGLFSLLVCLAPFPAIFRTARMAILGNFMAGVYALTMFGAIWRIGYKKKAVIIVTGIVLLLTGIVIFSDRNDAVSIVNVKKMMAVYNYFNDEYHANKHKHVPRKFHSVSVYNPDNLSLQDYVDYRDLATQSVAKAPSTEAENAGDGVAVGGQKQTEEATVSEESSAELIGGYENNRQIVTYSSAVFRLLVWQDLIDEYLIYKPIFGFDFGKPVRSNRLEVLRWSGQWERDGWVPVHNSLLHMIYRTGIVGIVFIFSMIVLFIRLTLGFLRLRSVKGILLCSIMVTWGVCANFLLTLEVPYTAVPVWSLYGMIFAYYQLKSQQAKEQNALEK